MTKIRDAVPATRPVEGRRSGRHRVTRGRTTSIRYRTRGRHRTGRTGLRPYPELVAQSAVSAEPAAAASLTDAGGRRRQGRRWSRLSGKRRWMTATATIAVAGALVVGGWSATVGAQVIGHVPLP